MPVIGIDFGTANCYVAKCDKGKVTVLQDELGNRKTPSCLAINGGKLLIGSDALDQIENNPESIALGVKRVIGRAFEDPVIKSEKTPCGIENVNGRPTISLVDPIVNVIEFRPEEIVAVLFKRMKEIAVKDTGEEVTGAVFTVPSSFKESQRRAIMDAAAIAGIRVLSLINESTAAAVAYSDKLKSDDCRKVLIFHLGAGTTTTAVVTMENRMIKVQSCIGSRNIGGNDFDEQVLKKAIEWLRRQRNFRLQCDRSDMTRLRAACSKAKKTLSHKGSSQARINFDGIFEGADLSMTITRKEFEVINAPIINLLVNMVEMALLKANIPKEKIDDVLVVGGAAKILDEMEGFSKKLPYFIQRTKMVSENEASVLGAAIMAGILSGQYKENAFAVHDIIPDNKTTRLGDTKTTLLGRNKGLKPHSVQSGGRKQTDYKERLSNLDIAFRASNLHVELVVLSRNCPLRLKPNDIIESAANIEQYQDKGQQKDKMDDALNELDSYARGLKTVLQSFSDSLAECYKMLKWINNDQKIPSLEDIQTILEKLQSAVATKLSDMNSLNAGNSKEFLAAAESLRAARRDNRSEALMQTNGSELDDRRHRNPVIELSDCVNEWKRILETSADCLNLCNETTAWIDKAEQVHPTLKSIQDKFSELLSNIFIPVAQLARRIEGYQQRNQKEALQELQEFAVELKGSLAECDEHLEQCNFVLEWIKKCSEKSQDEIWQTLLQMRSNMNKMTLSLESVIRRENNTTGRLSKVMNSNLGNKEALKVLKDFVIGWQQILYFGKDILNRSNTILERTSQSKDINPTLLDIRKEFEALKELGNSMIAKMEKLESQTLKDVEKRQTFISTVCGFLTRPLRVQQQSEIASQSHTQTDNRHESTPIDNHTRTDKIGRQAKNTGAGHLHPQQRTNSLPGNLSPTWTCAKDETVKERCSCEVVGRWNKTQNHQSATTSQQITERESSARKK